MRGGGGVRFWEGSARGGLGAAKAREGRGEEQQQSARRVDARRGGAARLSRPREARSPPAAGRHPGGGTQAERAWERMVGSAPASRSAAMASTWPCQAATCSAANSPWGRRGNSP